MSSEAQVKMQAKISGAPAPARAVQPRQVMLKRRPDRPGISTRPDISMQRDISTHLDISMRRDIPTQMQSAARLGHSLGGIRVDGSALPAIRPAPAARQEKGRVSPGVSLQKEGASVNNDESLEREADRMGAKALRMPRGEPVGRVQPLAKQVPQHGSPPAGGVVQRAIKVGGVPKRRTHEIDLLVEQSFRAQGLWAEFVRLNDDRAIIFNFTDEAHLRYHLLWLTGQGPQPAPPVLIAVSPLEQQQGHQRAQDERFHSLFSAAPNQIPQSAPGAHNIPAPMLPPPGTGHQWGQAPVGGGSEYTLYQHQFAGAPPTQPLTFGAPNAPSMVMNQGGLNLGMHIQPAPPANTANVTRATTTYGGLPSVPDRVRGHAYALEQTQISTENPAMTFDNDPRTYTDESDSTQHTGGTSTWRYSQVEKPSIRGNTPFTQVNENPVVGPMGVAQPPIIRYRVQNPDGSYDDRLMDNSGATDYRHAPRPAGVRQQANQSDMGRQAAVASPYVPPPVRQPGEDFMPPNRRTFPGYASPPATPFLGLAETEIVILAGWRMPGDRVHGLTGGRTGRVEAVLDRDYVLHKSRCRVVLDDL